MQFSAEIWRRSDNIQALGDFSKLIGEGLHIGDQRKKEKNPGIGLDLFLRTST
jgi:hypothetical protein